MSATRKRHAEFKVFRGKDGQFFWHLAAANRQIVAQSEGYTRKRDAERAKDDAIRAMNDAVMAQVIKTSQG